MQAVEGMVVSGHGVASGRSVGSAINPYPAGSIALQAPRFKALGLDLSDCFLGTINLNIAPKTWQLLRPTHRFEQVEWTHLHPPETFSFLRLHTNWQGQYIAGWLYYPHPETKAAHHQSSSTMEMLFPWMADLQLGARLRVACEDGCLRSWVLAG
jgi:hypothetical protein